MEEPVMVGWPSSRGKKGALNGPKEEGKGKAQQELVGKTMKEILWRAHKPNKLTLFSIRANTSRRPQPQQRIIKNK